MHTLEVFLLPSPDVLGEIVTPEQVISVVVFHEGAGGALPIHHVQDDSFPEV